jgi:RecA-family ATPase
VLIIVDTLARSFGPGDENSAQDMSKFIQNIDRYFLPFSAVALVHHSGHSEKNRGRGSSSLYGSLDLEYQVSKQNDIITMKCTKAKDMPPPPSISFEMAAQEIDWVDSEGEAVKSIVLNETEWKPGGEKSKPRLTGRNEAILAALDRAIEQRGVKPNKEITERFGGFGIGTGRKVVHVDHWREEAYPVIDVDADEREMKNKRAAFNRAKDALRKNHIQTMNGYWWVICD